ncbi:MAG: DegT/DnrJ/EryC1/StrS family aminotransferase [Methylocystis sp.]|uniref:DegT/DnrJ/EryC1/StrS family aminotransferase n=1 Tax=Methylocystis sp. TaxID=1911079 RepID=UPI003DA6A66F
MLKVPFLDLRVTDSVERGEILTAIETVLDHGRILLGPEVDELERRVAARTGREYAVGCNSGTDALIIALRALRIGPGDEVIVPALSFIATANAVSLVGATPVFGDLNDDLNISIESVASLVTPATKAVIPVHWAGRMCDMGALSDLARHKGLHIVEDASQAFDASIGDRKAGDYGIISCFSMNSMKVFASLGEAGILVTDDPQLHERCVSLRYHGLVNREFCTELAQNSRLDTLQAATLLVRLRRLDNVIETRRQNARYLNGRIEKYVDVPRESEGQRHVYYTYTIQADRRDDLSRYLAAQEIETKIQHPLLMPQHPVYAGRARGTWQKADRLIKRVLCLPSNEKLTAEQLARVADAVSEFYRS